jgi:hypothetical protein
MDAAWAWGVLGLAPGATPQDVRRAFRVSAQLLHPDRVAGESEDVRAEAHRRMVELAEAYRVCTALAAGEPPPPPRHDVTVTREGPLRSVGGQAATLLAEARARMDADLPWAAYREVVTTLEQVADAWPGTAEGDAARVALVTSTAAANALSPRERAGHLVLVADHTARVDAWESLWGRDELAVAQVVYAHPTADDDLRQRARHRLAELDDWSTLAGDPDDDVRRNAEAHLLLRDARSLAERAAWLSRRERASFDAEHAAWRTKVAALDAALPPSLRDDLARADAAISGARLAC